MQNSPANRVPSHGTHLFATAYAIDFVPLPPSGRTTAPITLASLFKPEDPEKFPGFGRPILAPDAGTVIACHDSESDHPAYRGLPSVPYALTQHRRLAAGWKALAGNHVFIRTRSTIVALCHLQQGSIAVRPGQKVRTGDMLARCGNSGNSTEPHLHVQAVDHEHIERATAVPITFDGELPRTNDVVDMTDLPRKSS